MISALLNLQESTARQLRRRRELRDIPVITRRNGDLGARLSEAIKLGRGLCIVVMPPEPTLAGPGGGTLTLAEVILRLRVVENAFAANPRHDALSVAELASRVLHGWQPPVPGITVPLALEEDDAWDVPDEPDKKGRYTIEVSFATAASI